ncbi:cytochrome-c peroxidase [Leptospira ilyithenensis]|uniref:Cytochrome-c peroxidase n=2 Tax=Leptospira ilyithenensis TaxID=2484901 RepID=A0A4R9LRG7_9LEPT|nr:cytochrome-c peroxidase [Leptospira ilyithenensis]
MFLEMKLYSNKEFCKIFLSLTLVCLFSACNPDPTRSKNQGNDSTNLLIAYLHQLPGGAEIQAEAKAKIGLLPANTPGSESDTQAQITLGNKIFRDNTLSLNHVQSCHTCHPLNGNSAGMDGQSTSRGTFGQEGRRNAPTILNVGYLPIIFWDGRKQSLFDQAVAPFLDSLEMALPSEAELLLRLQNNSDYASLFQSAFPDSPAISIDSLRKAISAFERSLISKSRFDDFIEWDLRALNNEEKQGLKTFLDLGCTNCHNGYLLGGTQFKKLDSFYSYNPSDLGRFEFTGNQDDKSFFKVPPLRNVTLTAPYFHDGSVRTLKEAVTRMNQYEMSRPMTDLEIDSIVTFLKSLSDKTKSN